MGNIYGRAEKRGITWLGGVTSGMKKEGVRLQNQEGEDVEE